MNLAHERAEPGEKDQRNRHNKNAHHDHRAIYEVSQKTQPESTIVHARGGGHRLRTQQTRGRRGGRKRLSARQTERRVVRHLGTALRAVHRLSLFSAFFQSPSAGPANPTYNLCQRSIGPFCNQASPILTLWWPSQGSCEPCPAGVAGHSRAEMLAMLAQQ